MQSILEIYTNAIVVNLISHKWEPKILHRSKEIEKLNLLLMIYLVHNVFHKRMIKG